MSKKSKDMNDPRMTLPPGVNLGRLEPRSSNAQQPPRRSLKVLPRLSLLAVSAAVLFMPLTGSAIAARGDCAQPVTDGATPSTSDCLHILNSAVGGATCEPECICAPSGILPVSASDALLCLRRAVQAEVSLDCPCEDPPSPRPNIVFILLDDASEELLHPSAVTNYFPEMDRLLYGAGTYFGNFLLTTPVCGPSRASILRGQFAHNSGIRTNFPAAPGSPEGTPTGGFGEFHARGYSENEIGVWMRDAGYKTMFIGKYHNSGFPDASGDSRFVPPGWDEFYASLGDRYYATPRLVNGTRGPDPPDIYRTDQEADDAIMLLRTHVDSGSSQPFFLYLASYAPHASTSTRQMAERHRDFYRSEFAPRLPNYNEADISDKSSPITVLPLLTTTMIDQADIFHVARIQSMLAVDEMIARLVDVLSELAVIDNTYIFLTSDNGFLLGNHRLVAKRSPYERAVRAPLLVRGPGVAANASRGDLLMAIDLAPTFLDLAGVSPPEFVDGQSFLPSLGGRSSLVGSAARDSIFAENWEQANPFGTPVLMEWNLLRLQDEVYIEWYTGEREYYDLLSDPYQLNNAYSNLPRVMREALADKLNAWRTCSGASCRGSMRIPRGSELGRP